MSERSPGPIEGFQDAIRRSAAYRRLRVAIGERRSENPAAHGVTGALFGILAATLASDLERPTLLLVPGDGEAEDVVGDLRLCGAADAHVLPSESAEFGARLGLVRRLASPEPPRFLVASVRAALEPLPSPRSADRHRLGLTVSAALDRDDLITRLVAAGFERVDLVERRLTFSVRGDVVDLFAAGETLPLRIAFDGDRIEDLRQFDAGTQLSVASRASSDVSLLTETRTGETVSLGAILPTDTLIFSRDEARQDEALQRHIDRLEPISAEESRECWRRLIARPRVIASRFDGRGPESFPFGSRALTVDGPRFEDAMTTLSRLAANRVTTVVAFETEAERHRFAEATAAHCERAHSTPPSFDSVVGRISAAFHAPILGLAMVNHHELFSITRARRTPAAVLATDARPIDTFLDLDVGDTVVHLHHGIARFEGIERIEKAGTQQDFLALSFRDDVRLLVPGVRIDLVQRYIGGRGESPELSRFGGKSWEKKKEAAAAAVSHLAAELLEIEARRAREPGISHPPDGPWQQEFEAAFPYDLTADQAKAIEAIKADMEAPRPMDRLLCGDVGFGKTEVAIRAAFKCVMGGRQVAVLVPTTLLTHQHLQSFRDRMMDYPVTIAGLSRFQSKAEHRRTLADLADGTVDIVIGTHRLVQDDVRFKELGLLVVDEEQRFGVAHKECLRRGRVNVDLLTLTATPIPRTLNQALLGIRNISSLEMPPLGRQAVQTEVLLRDRSVIQAAIARELDREGQVYVIHNRVETIHRVAKEVQELAPRARIVVGHGQLPERELEETMVAFVSGQADVLVATTIVESGLDIPRANTILVDRANLYGLADLHQLRGRVGRYKVQAYAYFLLDPGSTIDGDAEKRLAAIAEFSRLGSGFRIAMRDMEIRGVGNILGGAQSGHIASVGYDLYCRLLDAAVKSMRKDRVTLPVDVELNVDFTAFLPEGYIQSRRLRIELYRKLARARAVADFERLLAEMEDRFGPPPDEARQFVHIARMRAFLEEREIPRLDFLPDLGPVLTPRRPQAFLRDLALGADLVLRPLDRGRFLLVPKSPPKTPAELLSVLESAFRPLYRDEAQPRR